VTPGPYDRRVIPPLVIGLALLVALVALPPARRLQLAGLEPRLIGSYTTLLWIGGMLVVLAPGATRWLVPILLIAWLGPFVVAPERLGRVMRRGGTGSRLIKDVTPRKGPRDLDDSP
jgi:hypothetical protein